MKRITIFVAMMLTGFLAACDQVNTGGAPGQLVSDGYVSYSVNGTPIIAHDSLLPGDPGFYEIGASYLDSTLKIEGGAVVFGETAVQITIAHCFDTGTYLLSADTTVSSFGSVILSESFGVSGYSIYTYSTDSIYTGILHLTQFDLVAHKLTGTFTFLARDHNGTSTDTVRVINGVLYNFPLNRN